nr:RIP metalloprotease RseP [Lachnospiraceae bacterium]
MGIVLFILIFCVVVIAHEFGHFIIAKMNGIHVVEFSVGMGPCIFSFTKGGTKYAIRLLPLGGACMFEGEDGLNLAEDESGGEPAEKSAEMKSAEKTDASPVRDTQLGKKSGAFPDAPVFVRIATVIAGPIFNFILAFFFSMIIVGSYGADMPVVTTVLEDGAAYEAGLRDGDKIVRMDGNKIHLYREISLRSMLNRGENIEVTYERDGETYQTVITPIYDEAAQRYYMGLSGVGQYVKPGFAGTLKYSAYEVGYWIETTFKSLELLIQGQVTKDDVSGPVGMAQTVNNIYNQSKPDGVFYIWLNMLNFAILLSANLGVLNLLPFPALDGGRLVFLVVEAVRGKPVPPEKEGFVHMIGMVCLMVLMVFVLYNDIAKLF